MLDAFAEALEESGVLTCDCRDYTVSTSVIAEVFASALRAGEFEPILRQR